MGYPFDKFRCHIDTVRIVDHHSERLKVAQHCCEPSQTVNGGDQDTPFAQLRNFLTALAYTPPSELASSTSINAV